jgi:N utilization substance protein B
MLYQWELGGGELDASLDSYLKLHASPDLVDAPPLAAFATALVRGVVERQPELDTLIDEQAENWRLSRMAVTDRIILRLAVYEFLYASDTPRPVVIDEAVELAKTFSGDEAGGFVNGVLDGIRRRLESRT